jgi:hypothetical protein
MNNEKKKLNSNSYGPSYVNQDAKQQLSLDYFNRSLIISVGPYDKNNFQGFDKTAAKAIISAGTASIVEDVLVDCYEAFKKGEKFNESIPTGLTRSNVIQFCDGAVLGAPYGLYLVLHEDVNESSRKPKRSEVYTFRDTLTIKDYDANTGNSKASIKKSREAKDVIRTIKNYIEGANHALAHAVKDNVKFDEASKLRSLAALLDASGGSYSKPAYNNNGGGNNRKSGKDIFDSSTVTGTIEGFHDALKASDLDFIEF